MGVVHVDLVDGELWVGDSRWVGRGAFCPCHINFYGFEKVNCEAL